MIFKKLEEDATLRTNYLLSVPVLVYNSTDNKNDLDKIAQKLADIIIEKINTNIKYIKESLNLQEFEIRFHEFNIPTLSLLVFLEKSIATDEIERVIGRYFNSEVTDKDTNITMKAVHDWLICQEYFNQIENDRIGEN